MQALVWARVPGDLVFACGVLAFAAFVVQAFLSGRTAREPRAAAAVLDPR
jgi:nitric oxide reductase subunit B